MIFGGQRLGKEVGKNAVSGQILDRELALANAVPQPFCRISLLLRALVCKSATADHLCEEF
jgi:hypothetical protein